jgi:transposase InsO family protein
VLGRLNLHRLRVNPSKCHFGYTKVLMLGHFISGSGRAIDPMKAKQALEWPTPKCGKDVQRLLGFTNFVSGYVEGYHKFTSALNELRNVKKFDIDAPDFAKAKHSFEYLKKVINESPILSVPDTGLPFLVATDASQTGLGAVLYQLPEGPEGKPSYIAFASTSLKGAQRNYGASKRELLGIIFALREFHTHLYGTPFVLYTDHKALASLFTARKLSYVLENWLDTLLEYDFEPRHRPGTSMLLPDALSRMHADFEDATTEQHSIKSRRQHEPELDENFEEAAKQASETEMPIRPATKLKRSLPIDEVANYPDKELAVFIKERHLKVQPPTKADRAHLLNQEHDNAHFGAEALFKAIWRRGYYWPGLRKECRERVGRCRSCLHYNVGREGFHPVRSLQSDEIWGHVAVDSCGPFPVSESQMVYIIILVDVKSRFLVTRAVPNLQMVTISRVLYEIFCTFGPPGALQSDNGPEYVNRLVEQLLAHANVDNRKTAPWNPRANGLPESFVKIVKACLKKVLTGEYANWDEALPGITAAINNHDSARSRTAPFTLFMNRAANHWADYRLAQVLGPDLGELQEALQEFDPPPFEHTERIATDNRETSVQINAAVDAATNERQRIINAAIDRKRKSIVRNYPTGATVFIINEDFVSKLDPTWVGPFYVHRQSTRNRTYHLKDVEGAKLGRPVPIAKIKWVSDKTVALYNNDGQEVDTAAERGIVKSILQTKKTDGTTSYLVEWKDATEPNEWLKKEDFDDPSALADYWRKTKPATKKRKVLPANEQPPPPAKRKSAKPITDLAGRTINVPATWFTKKYAKEEYGANWNNATEQFVVLSKHNQGSQWTIHKASDPSETYLMSANAIRTYLPSSTDSS